jgi:hypothetical protein
MPGALYRYLAFDHERLEQLLNDATAEPGVIRSEPYEEFRKGLLRHIGMEERFVIPEIARSLGKPPALAEKIRLEHGALVSLMVPTPTSAIVATLRAILKKHNALEEGGEDGLYAQFEKAAGKETDELLAELRATPEVPVVPHNDRPGVLESVARTVKRAGYEMVGDKT